MSGSSEQGKTNKHSTQKKKRKRCGPDANAKLEEGVLRTEMTDQVKSLTIQHKKIHPTKGYGKKLAAVDGGAVSAGLLRKIMTIEPNIGR